MKKLLRFLLEKLVIVFEFFFSYKTFKFIKNIKTRLFSYWIRLSFAKCGKVISVQSPVYIKGGQYMTIGENFNSLERLRLECWDEYAHIKFSPCLIIGNHVVMNYNVHIGCINKIVIGNNVLFGSNILITDHQHGYVDNRDLGIEPIKRALSTNGPVIIEDNVWIGENVAIMPNVTIGTGSIIGANSVVTKSFPENSVLAGAPAKLLRSL